MRMQAGVCSRAGQRGDNEDAFVVDVGQGLFTVADGVGGYEGGGVASRLVVRAVSEVLAQPPGDGVEPAERLGEALRVANRQVHQRRRGRLALMGSTVAALLVDGGAAVVGHVGDSRVYRLREGRLECLTRDHTVGAQLAAAGVDGSAQAHVLTRALGTYPVVAPELRLATARRRDVFLLCTDGLSGALREGEMARLMRALAPAQAARALAARAVAAGASDDVTALVVRPGGAAVGSRPARPGLPGCQSSARTPALG